MIKILNIHRYPAGILAFLILLSIGLSFSQSIAMPAADGPRFSREMVLALAPTLLSVTSLPVVDQLDSTLPRGRVMMLTGAAFSLVLCLLLGCILWIHGGVHGVKLVYELSLLLWLSSIGIILARTIGGQGPLIMSALSLVTCLYWNSFAHLLGFSRTNYIDSSDYQLSPWGIFTGGLSVAITLFALFAPPSVVQRMQRSLRYIRTSIIR